MMGETTNSALYVGSVLHRRMRPKQHTLKHACYWIYFDIERIDAIAQRLKLFSYNRFNVLGYRDGDHGDGSGRPLRAQVETLLHDKGIPPPDGAYRLLCMPRVLGYSFNPLSVFFCHDRDETLRAIVYEVHNTFGERHHYVFRAEPNQRILRHSCDKEFYVSPFMDMSMSYDFRLHPPAENVSVGINTFDRKGLMLFAGLRGERRPFEDAQLLRLAVTQPLLTIKVIAAIHVHAALLWLKGLNIRRWKPGLRRHRRGDHSSPAPGE